jgi:RNA-directed DNA polymerase
VGGTSRVSREAQARICERLGVKSPGPTRRLPGPTHPFGPHRYKKDGRWYLGASPSKKAVARIKEKVGNLLIPSNTGTWEEVRGRLNQILRGWSAYFSYGTRVAAYDAVDNYVYESVRHFLRRRHQVQSRGTSCFSKEAVFGELGVLQLRRVQVNPRS